MKKRSFVFAAVLVLLLAYTSLSSAKKIVVMNLGSLEGTTKAINTFTEKTGIDVEIIMAASWADFDEKLRLMIATGQQLDAMRFWTSPAVSAALDGLLMPLTQFIERDGLDLSQYPSSILWHPPYKSLGELYTLPYNMSVHALFYNRDHLQQAGVSIPSTEYGDSSLQWDNWVQMARKLKRVDGNGNVTRWGATPARYLHIPAFGVDWVNERVDKFLGAEPGVVDAFTQITDMWLTDEVAPKPHQRSGVNIQSQNVSTSIARTGVWLTQLDPSEVDLGVSPMPWGTKHAIEAGINSWGISANTKEPDAAWEFVKYFTYGEGVAEWMKYESLSPPVHKAYGSAWIDAVQSHLPNADLSIILRAGEYYVPSRIELSPVWGDVAPVFRGAIDNVESGEKSMSVAMNEVKDQINAYLNANPLIK